MAWVGRDLRDHPLPASLPCGSTDAVIIAESAGNPETTKGSALSLCTLPTSKTLQCGANFTFFFFKLSHRSSELPIYIFTAVSPLPLRTCNKKIEVFDWKKTLKLLIGCLHDWMSLTCNHVFTLIQQLASGGSYSPGARMQSPSYLHIVRPVHKQNLNGCHQTVTVTPDGSPPVSCTLEAKGINLLGISHLCC